jgi:20S proteasome alpha/beta subunit
MTLVIGSRCNDGVIVAADQKVIRGGEVDYQRKIFDSSGILFAFEGLTGLVTDFMTLLDGERSQLGEFTSLYHAKLVMEDIVKGFSDRYAERLQGNVPFGASIAGLRDINGGSADLYYIYQGGYGESVQFRCSGNGAPYAYSIATHLMSRENSCNVNAARAAFVISWVASVDHTVGGTPQVAILRDNVPKPQYLNPQIVDSLSEHSERLRGQLRSGSAIPKSPNRR